MSKLDFAFIVAFLSATPLSAETILGVDSSSDSLSIVDLKLAKSRILGPLDPGRKSFGKNNRAAAPTALAIRPTDNALFVWNNASVGVDPRRMETTWQGLLRVDARTGSAHYVGGSGQAGALAFGPGEKLYRFDRSLWRVDPSNGSSQAIGPLQDEDRRVLSAHGAAYDPSSKSMFVSAYGGPSSNPVERAVQAHRLYKVDLSSGLLRKVLDINIPKGWMIGDIVFADGGRLYATGFSGLETGVFRLDVVSASTVVVSRSRSMTGSQGLGIIRQ